MIFAPETFRGDPGISTPNHIHIRKENTMTDQDTTHHAAAELRQFVERLEQLDAKKADIAQQHKEVMAEATARGYDPLAMRRIVSLRNRDADDIAEEEATLDLYKQAMGM